ncbi:SDR family NAD(P)-dependent oxidoreductase [Rhodobacter sp. NTK016B]|nr:SDR family NAD(P)-dependent oxidoreductase [Rhodobacter sp. NTK016B]
MNPLAPVIVTGASRGIGRELVSQLLAQGHSVIGVARTGPDLPESPTFRFIPYDLFDRAEVARLVDTLRPLRPRGLINNAGLQTSTDLARLSPGAAAELVGTEIAAHAKCAAKAGLANMSIALRGQARAAPGLLVCEANLPLVETDMTRGRGTGKITPAAAAEAILRALAHRRTRVWIGKTRILALLGRLAPGIASRLLLGRVAEPN